MKQNSLNLSAYIGSLGIIVISLRFDTQCFFGDCSGATLRIAKIQSPICFCLTLNLKEIAFRYIESAFPLNSHILIM
jgi:hypothetical protein